MAMYNLIEYSDNYSKISGSLSQFCRDEPPLNNAATTESESFTLKSRSLNNTNNSGAANVKIAVPLKYLSNSWRTLQMYLIICKINFMVTWSGKCVIFDRATLFTITDRTLYVPKVTLSTQDKAKI